ncbi:store-operated calcium entry regulator STIMATE isoform X1 [Octopus bimaculoides]|uniref:Store-operated calcium entry regulator STIMATE n=2 Tax=Octopus bimaculoides TaxID=37653 RepID=A0A0L8GU95_OCTBM|nr:store-operated calcium entry regulator STIMATE isoform X1 [Octopus bimaculoides]|eukprot:XP_014777945.1 PREDICTED: store-operated calcium entry regulator STIMATE-like [Octopus bimaculoides]
MLFQLGNTLLLEDGQHSVSVVAQELTQRQLVNITSLNGSSATSFLLFSRLFPSRANNTRYSHQVPASTRLPSDTTEAKLLMDVRCSPGDLLGPLGLFVQALLAFLAFTTLIAKRFCEPKHERRPWKIWFYDTSKQAIGAAVIHFANVFLADMFQGDPCTWYFVSFLLDSTVGLLVIYIGLKIGQWLALRKGWESLRFGEYGRPPQCNAWIGQCGLYILVMIIEKILMTLLVLCHFWVKVRKFILAPVKNANLEIVIVMFMVPLFVNALIFWVVDNFLKRQIRETKTLSINSNDVSVKYFRNNDRLKYYNHLEKAEDFETNMLLMEDEEINTSTVGVGNNNTTTNLLLD